MTFLLCQSLQIYLLQLIVTSLLVRHFSSPSFCLLNLPIFCQPKRILFNLMPFILFIIILLYRLNNFLQLLSRVLIHSVKYGPGKSLPMTNNIVPFFFQWSLFNHRFIIIPVTLISIYTKLHKSFLFLLFILNGVIFLLMSDHLLLLFLL